MTERRVTLMRHNRDALSAAEAAMLVIGVRPERVAERVSARLAKLTVGDIAKKNRLPAHLAARYPQPAYPNAQSPEMKQAIIESVIAMREGLVRIVPDYAPDGNQRVSEDHICRACANNDGNGGCTLFDRVFMIISDHSGFKA